MEKPRPKLIATLIFVSINVFLQFSEATVSLRASQFNRYGTDISLSGHLIGAYSGITLFRCSFYCSEHHPLCAAFNFDPFSQKCELLSDTSSEFPSDVVASVGVWHYHVINPESTTEVMMQTETAAVQNGRVMHTAGLTTVGTVVETTAMLDRTTKIKTTTNPTIEPTTRLTKRPSTEQTTQPTTEPTTERMTDPTTPVQTTSAGCDQVTTITEFCDETFTSECQKVATPNYPGYAPDGISCGFSVQAPDGQEAQLFFEDFGFESHTTCSYDHIEVYDGVPPSLNNFRPPLLCGSSADPLATTNGFIFIFVYTDGSIQSRGMSVRLVFSKICGKTFSTNGQEISSPFYPDPLPFGITEYVCQFRIVAPTGSTVRIEFSFLHMEAHNACKYDRIEFYNEDDVDSRQPLVTVCGETVPTNPVYLNTDSVVVKVITDAIVVSNGFIFTYWFE